MGGIMGDDKKKEAEKKVLDEKDEAFCGFCSIQQLDQDGISGRTLGSNVKAPLNIVSAEGADPMVLEAVFQASNPLFYLELKNEERFYIWGQFWIDNPKHSESNNFCTLTPQLMSECHTQMEKSGSSEFQATALCEFLRNSTSRLLKVTFASEEKKFKTKVTKVSVTVPRDAWMEFKQYRVRLWKAGKNWAASEKEDKDEDKEGEKKDG